VNPLLATVVIKSLLKSVKKKLMVNGWQAFRAFNKKEISHGYR
jgi:hypothetical protein